VQMLRELLKHDRRFLFGFVIMVFFLLITILSFFNPYEDAAWNVFPRDLPPSGEHLLGTNSMGQDIFWKATTAVRNSLVLSLVAAIISRTIAVVIGLISGYKGGMADIFLMTLNDSFVIIPLFPILILVANILKSQINLLLLGVILGLFGWAWDARLFRSQILSLRQREFTYTAVYSGMTDLEVVMKEHLPFVIPLVMAATLNNIIWVIGMEVSLGVLGLSSLDVPTLGTMIFWATQYQAIFLGMWNWILTPVLICVFLILGLYMLSVSIGQFLDPRTRLQIIKSKDE
jgi:peptide/nickel transport system permease protein